MRPSFEKTASPDGGVSRHTSSARISFGTSLGWMRAAAPGSKRLSRRCSDPGRRVWRGVRRRAEILVARQGRETVRQQARGGKTRYRRPPREGGSVRKFHAVCPGPAGKFAGGEDLVGINDVDKVMGMPRRSASGILAVPMSKWR